MGGNSEKRPLRLRYIGGSERYESYAFLIAWPFLFLLPYGGHWRWGVAFVPDLLMRGVRAWRRRTGTLVTTRPGDGGVELVAASGDVVDRLVDADVEYVSRVVNAAGRPESVDIVRVHGKPMSFAADSVDEVARIVQELRIDLDSVRSRYRTGSRAVRLSFALMIGFAILAWGIFAPPSDPQLVQWLSRYTNWITLPLIVLFAIPTWVEIGADGVAWRWLVLRGYASFASTSTFEPIPGGFRLTMSDGTRHWFALAKGAGTLFERHLEGAWAKARERAGTEPVPIDTALKRLPDETLDAWVARLRSLRSNGTAYRAHSTTHLWEVAEDTSAPFEARCAALILVSTTAAARDRARAIATRIVAPQLRVAVERIADDAATDDLVKHLASALAVTPSKPDAHDELAD